MLQADPWGRAQDWTTPGLFSCPSCDPQGGSQGRVVRVCSRPSPGEALSCITCEQPTALPLCKNITYCKPDEIACKTTLVTVEAGAAGARGSQLPPQGHTADPSRGRGDFQAGGQLGCPGRRQEEQGEGRRLGWPGKAGVG